MTFADLRCPALAGDIRGALKAHCDFSSRRKCSPSSIDSAFRFAMDDVVRVIREKHGRRFDLFKQFIVNGSLLPSWDTSSKNSGHPLNDEEVASCIDFITGQMVTKFQGKLAELLSIAPIIEIVRGLDVNWVFPQNVSIVLGSDIRCRPQIIRGKLVEGGYPKGVDGPDIIAFRKTCCGRIQILLVGEIKSMRVSFSSLRRQMAKHLTAISRGLSIRGKWYDRDKILMGMPCRRKGEGRVIQVYVRPSSWHLTRKFHLVPDAQGATLASCSLLTDCNVQRFHPRKPISSSTSSIR